MSDARIRAFMSDCVRRLEQKQSELFERGLEEHERFELDLLHGKLRFFNGEALALEADVTPIGTHIEDDASWQWAWANRSLPEAVRERAARIKELATQTACVEFSERTLEIDETRTWELVAAACEHLGALGTYHCPNRNARLYLAIERFCDEPVS
jgi:hypothetical protein